MRVMIRIDAATYGESVHCTPRWLLSEPSGPIEKGTTYIVRPCIEPPKSSISVVRISSGSRQLFVGPASSSRGEQMNVRSSTRATSPGSERARKEPGRFCSESFVNVPASSSVWQSCSNSSCEPSHQCTSRGSVSAATSSTQLRRRLFFVGALSLFERAGAVVCIKLERATWVAP